MVSNIISQMQSAIFEKQASIILKLKIRVVRYPKFYLESIFYNFISNSLKYSNPAELPEIIISSDLEGGRVRLAVKDNGLGIDLDRYGHKVFKLNQTFHSGYESKGIGLYITKTQVESLGGTVQVKSRENEGSEFSVIL